MPETYLGEWSAALYLNSFLLECLMVPNLIPCSSNPCYKKLVNDFAQQLRSAAPSIGDHNLSEEEFWNAGIFQAAIERLRGTQAATTDVKYKFVKAVLEILKENAWIKDWNYTGASGRQDFSVFFEDGYRSVVEAKGCLDGNNTNIFERPNNADEFIIWSLCQNPGADVPHNVWSGIHTRLGATMLAEKKQIDGLVVWDPLCSSISRACPKLKDRVSRRIGALDLPSPCMFLFPKRIPNVESLTFSWELSDVRFLQALYNCFNGSEADVAKVRFEVRKNDRGVQRRTIIKRENSEEYSEWAALRREST